MQSYLLFSVVFVDICQHSDVTLPCAALEWGQSCKSQRSATRLPSRNIHLLSWGLFNAMCYLTQYWAIIFQKLCEQGHSQGAIPPSRGHAPSPRVVEFFYGKNWLCWDVGPALFSKVTVFSVSEVFCGPQICKKWTPLTVTTKLKVVNLWRKKVQPRSFCAANVKSWLRVGRVCTCCWFVKIHWIIYNWITNHLEVSIKFLLHSVVNKKHIFSWTVMNVWANAHVVCVLQVLCIY